MPSLQSQMRATGNAKRALISSPAPAQRAQEMRVVSGIAAAMLALYLLHLVVVAHLVEQGVGLHVDEAQYWDWSRDLAWGYYSKPPAIAVLIAASSALFGDGVLGIKVLAMLCYPATSIVLYLLGRDMAGQRVGVIAAVSFAVTPLAGLLGLAATTDAPLLLAWSLSLWALWRAWTAPHPRSWMALGLACGLGLLSKYTAAAFVLTIAGFVWSERHDRVFLAPRLWGLGLAAGVALLVLAPNLLWNAMHGWPTFRHTAEITAAARHLRGWPALAAFGEFAIGQALAVGPMFVAWALALRQGRSLHERGGQSREQSTSRARRLCAWSSLPLLAVGGLQAAHAGAEVNWAAPAIPGLCLWLALVAAPRPGAGCWLWACVVVQLALTLAVVLAGDIARWAGRPLPASLDVWVRMRGWQEAFGELAPALRGRSGMLVVGTSRAVLAQGAYALRMSPLDWAAWSEDGDVHHHYQLSRPVPADAGWHGAVLVVGDGPASPALKARFGELLPVAVATVPVTPPRRVELRLWEAHSPVVVPEGAQ